MGILDKEIFCRFESISELRKLAHFETTKNLNVDLSSSSYFPPQHKDACVVDKSIPKCNKRSHVSLVNTPRKASALSGSRQTYVPSFSLSFSHSVKRALSLSLS